jgi:hypothetical protein
MEVALVWLRQTQHGWLGKAIIVRQAENASYLLWLQALLLSLLLPLLLLLLLHLPLLLLCVQLLLQHLLLL